MTRKLDAVKSNLTHPQNGVDIYLCKLYPYQ